MSLFPNIDLIFAALDGCVFRDWQKDTFYQASLKPALRLMSYKLLLLIMSELISKYHIKEISIHF